MTSKLPPKRHRLTKLAVSEISLVPSGANPEANIIIAKAAKMKTCADCKDEASCIKKGHCAGAGDPKKVAKALNMAVAELAPAIAKAAAAHLGDFPDAVATLASIITETSMDMEELQAALDAANAKTADLEASLAKAKKEPDPTLAAELAVYKGKLETQGEIIAKMILEKDTGAAIAKAKEIGVGDPAVLGPILLRIEKGATTAEDATALTQILKTAAAHASANVTKLTTRVGGKAPGGAAPGEHEFTALAKARAKEDKCSEHQAVAKIMTERPELYAQYLADNPAQSVG